MAEIVQFLSDHRWIYDIQVTRLFVEQWWNAIPHEVLVQSISSLSCMPRYTQRTCILNYCMVVKYVINLLQWREPLAGLTVDELNQLPFGFTKVYLIIIYISSSSYVYYYTCALYIALLQATWPSSLKMLILQSQQLSLSRSVPPSVSMMTVDISPKIKAGMTPKKSHEVRAKLILNVQPFHDFSFIR